MVYRMYSKEENELVKVFTPSHIDELHERGVIGFDTRTYEVKPNTSEESMGIEPSEYDAVAYIDNALSICRKTSGWDFIPCQEHVEGRVLYRCFFCHQDEQNQYCQGVLSSGRRCTVEVPSEGGWRYSDEHKYCQRHLRENERAGFRFSLDNLDEWLDGWQRETVMLWKRSFIRRLQGLENIAYEQIMAMKKVLDGVKGGTIRVSSLPSKTNVYFIYCDGYVKIGRSKDPDKRFADLCREGDTTIRPDGINMANAKLLGSVVGNVYLEGGIHGRLYEKRVAGEWFHYDSDVASLIDVLIGSGDMTVEWVIDDIIKNYDAIISHDVQGGWDFKETRETVDKKDKYKYAIEKRESARIKEYGN